LEVVVERLSIVYLIFLFVIYILAHTGIVIWYKKIENNTDEEGKDTRKVLKFLSKWFHVIYAVVVLILLLAF